MKEIEKQFIPYEQALKLKELGFNEECFGYYNMINHSGEFKFDIRIWENSDDYIEAPLWQQAIDWHCIKTNSIITWPNYYDGKVELLNDFFDRFPPPKGWYVKNPKCEICKTDLTHEWLDGDYSLLICDKKVCYKKFSEKRFGNMK